MSVYAEVCSDCLADEPVIVPPACGIVSPVSVHVF